MEKRTQEIVRGDGYASDVYEVLDENSDPLDLTGYTMTAQVRVSEDAEEEAFAFTVDKTNPAEGLFRLRLTPADTQNLQLSVVSYGPTLFFYDVQLQEDADPTNVVTIIRGPVKVHSDVSRV